MNGAPKFLVLEGCNGVGKSTTARYLSARLGAALFHYPPEFSRFRQEVELDVRVAPLPRLMYYLAASLHLSDLVRDQLACRHVICDRYLASPLSLLSAAAALEERDIDRLTTLFEPYLHVPDLIVLLTAEHAEACARLRRRQQASGNVTPVERRVLESAEFFRKREAALRRHSSRLGLLVEMDTTGLSVEEMVRSAWNLIAQALGFAAGPGRAKRAT